jgi:hypothetical protein
MGLFPGEFFTSALCPLPQQFFLVERWILGSETFTLRRTMRAEPFQIRNFIDGQFVEPIPSLSFRAKSRNLWIFLRAAWYDPNAF